MRFRRVIISLACFLAVFSNHAEAEIPDSIKIKARQLQNLIEERSEKACVILQAPNGDLLLNHNPKEKMMPASIAKIPLMLTAFDYLKPNFKFVTEFYIDAEKNLIIKGYGDPLFISEEISSAARRLKSLGYTQFKSITLDESFFNDELGNHLSSSDNPYDATNGALVVNFNTVHVGRDQNGRLFSPEPQTPLPSIAQELAAALPKNSKKRYNVGYRNETNLLFKKQIISELFAREAIYVLGEPAAQYNVKDFKLILSFRGSSSLRDIASGLMKYSNNFIANQIMMVMGAEYYEPPASFIKGRVAFNKVLDDIFPTLSEEYDFAEGSGLSRESFTTCNFMIEVLDEYKNYHETLTYSSRSYSKTGTLNGVNNLAGYITGKNRLYPFVLILYTYSNLRSQFLGIMENLVQEYEEETGYN